MHKVKPILTATLTLTLICALVVAALAGTNLLTKGPIEQNAAAASQQARMDVLPTATRFEKIETIAVDGVEEVYCGLNDSNEIVGYVVKTITSGKGTEFVMMTAVSADGCVLDFKVISNNETAGYVGKVENGGLFDRLKGIDEDPTAEESMVDGVSGATKTSNAVKDGIRLALQVYKEVTADGQV